jgi:Leucine-rich repeat (LRR) protein
MKVLSNNSLTNVDQIRYLTSLKKLSLSNNQLKTLPELNNFFVLKEIRLAHNKLLLLPDSLGIMPRLSILDLGSNLLDSLK